MSDAAMETVAAQLDAAFEGDPQIDEFDYFFAADGKAGEPGVDIGGIFATSDPCEPSSESLKGCVQVVDHKVGLSHVCVKPLYKYAQRLFDEKKYQSNRLSVIVDYEVDDLRALSTVSRIMLLIKGESHMIFNLRKYLIGLGVINVPNELVFLKVLFSKHAKSPSGWQHRRWCLLFADKASKGETMKDELIVNWPGEINDTYRPNEHVKIPIESEIELCQLSAEKHPKNYYAWMHRLWLTQFMAVDQIQRECSLMNLWLQQHVSDHSAAAYSCHIIKINNILSNCNKQSDVLNDEPIQWTSSSVGMRSKYLLSLLHSSLEECAGNIGRRPGSEALFSHRRGLSDALFRALAGCAPCGGGWVLLAGADDPAMSAPLDDIINSEFAAPLDTSLDDALALYHLKCKKYNQTLNYLYYSPQYCGSPEMLTLLHLFLECEILFFKMCTRVECHWNGGRQRLLANRYFAFLLYRISVYLCSVSKSYIPKVGYCNPQEVEVGVKTAAGIALSGKESSFIFKVNRALNALSQRLSREDSASKRLWQAMDEQTSISCRTIRSSGSSQLHHTPLPAYTTERYYLLSEIEQNVGAANFICRDEDVVRDLKSGNVSKLSAVKYADHINRITECTIRIFYLIWNLKADKDGSGFKLQVIELLKGVCALGRDELVPSAQLAVELLVPSSFDATDINSAEYAVVADKLQWVIDTFSHIFGYIVFGIADDAAGTPALEAILTSLQHFDRTINDDEFHCLFGRARIPFLGPSLPSTLVVPTRQQMLGHDVMREPDAKSDVKQCLLGSLSQEQLKEWCSKVARKKVGMLLQANIQNVLKTKEGGHVLWGGFVLLAMVILFLLYSYLFMEINKTK